MLMKIYLLSISIDKIIGVKITRKIAANGNILYLSGDILLYMDNKLNGKTVEIQEANLGRELLISQTVY